MKKAELGRVKPLASIWGKKDDSCGYKERWPESDPLNANWSGSTLQRWEWELEWRKRREHCRIPNDMHKRARPPPPSSFGA